MCDVSEYLKTLPINVVKRYAREQQIGDQFALTDAFYKLLASKLNAKIKCQNVLLTDEEWTDVCNKDIVVMYLDDCLKHIESYCYSVDKNNIGATFIKKLEVEGEYIDSDIKYYSLISGHYIDEKSLPLDKGLYKGIQIGTVDNKIIYRLIKGDVSIQTIINLIIEQNKKTDIDDYISITPKVISASEIEEDTRMPEWA